MTTASIGAVALHAYRDRHAMDKTFIPSQQGGRSVKKTINKIAKFWIFPLCMLACIPTSGWSACTQTTKKPGVSYYTAILGNMEVPDFSPGAIPINDVIYSYTGTAVISNIGTGYSKPYIDCPSPGVEPWVGGVGPLSGDDLYLTSINNIKIRLIAEGTVLPFLYSTKIISSSWRLNFPITIELVKTGNITAGGFLSGSFAQYREGGSSGQLLVDFRFPRPVKVTPRVPTCRAPAAVSVEMDDVLTMAFTGIGSVSPRTKAFSIDLTCTGGDAGTLTRAFVTLTDSITPTNTSDILPLSARDSIAKGLGIQMLGPDGQPLRFGPDSASTGNPNQWFAGDIMQGVQTFKIPLAARYIQTADKITPGLAVARATFTMSYQ